MFNQKTIVVGVCGGIAAYKTCELVSRLKKSGANVFCRYEGQRNAICRSAYF